MTTHRSILAIAAALIVPSAVMADLDLGSFEYTPGTDAFAETLANEVEISDGATMLSLPAPTDTSDVFAAGDIGEFEFATSDVSGFDVATDPPLMMDFLVQAEAPQGVGGDAVVTNIPSVFGVPVDGGGGGTIEYATYNGNTSNKVAPTGFAAPLPTSLALAAVGLVGLAFGRQWIGRVVGG